MHKMFFLIASFGLYSQLGLSSAIKCRVVGNEGGYLLIGNSENILTSDEVALIGSNDVIGTYNPVYGLSAVDKPTEHSISFTFKDSRAISWDKIDPEEKCYQIQGAVYRVSNLQRVTADTLGLPRYTALLEFSPNVLVHPKKPNCRTPDFEVRPPQDLDCDTVSIEVHK